VRITGQPPLAARVYELQKLRCHLCGEVFTAPAPAEAGERKYDATAGSMIALLKYGSGLPFNRLEGLQGNLETPLPASTQWDIVAAVANQVAPVFEELIQVEAAQLVAWTTRHVRRMLKRPQEDGDEAVIHGLRGRPFSCTSRRCRGCVVAR
jgi:hypothetical protein